MAAMAAATSPPFWDEAPLDALEAGLVAELSEEAAPGEVAELRRDETESAAVLLPLLLLFMFRLRLVMRWERWAAGSEKQANK